MSEDDWRNWKNGKYDKRYKGVKKHSGKREYKTPIVISVIIISAILGFFIYQTHGMPQSIQNEASNIANNAGNKIQQLSSQVSQQSNSLLQNSKISSTNQDTPLPTIVYDNCQSFIRTDFHSDMDSISTTCILPAPNYQKQFKFNVPSVLEQTMQGSSMGFVKTQVYQYGQNDFKIGLFDQVGEKNYTVTLWQLPQ